MGAIKSNDAVNPVFLNMQIGFNIKIFILKKLYYVGSFYDVIEISTKGYKFLEF